MAIVSSLRAPLRIVAYVFVFLILLIPLGMLHDLVIERMIRLDSTREEISSTWGGSQLIAGPIVVVPVTRIDRVQSQTGVWRELRQDMDATFLPRTVDWQGEVVPEIRRRGLFEAVVFRAEVQGEAEFRVLRPKKLDELTGEVHWRRARLLVGLGDNRGLEAGVTLSLGGEPLDVTPGAVGGDGVFSRGFGASLEPWAEHLEAGEALPPLRLGLSLRGSRTMQFLPVGETTSVDLQGPWTAPSFSGAFLPNERSLDAEGFEGSWVVPWTARSAPQAYLGPPKDLGELLVASAFGVDLILPADAYQKVDRAAKYGVLFLVLTFVAYILAEIGAPKALHPVHYGLIGAALTLFYVLLLALAEHVGFATAYSLATVATALLVGAYTSALLPRARALILTLLLGGFYGYLYVTLAAEDFALLLGASGLFAALAAVMWATRHIDFSTMTIVPKGPASGSEEVLAPSAELS